MDGFGIDLALLLLLIVNIVVIHLHVTHCSFLLFDLVVSENKLSLICLTYLILYFSFFI
jgi:hypothetical protein